ncbi:Retinal-specific ATP-binding cassette transporter [Lasiodiplodia hormozganensis]|uniref:Retinal-specific ATP-binding cassette transporter n=1 Tax=Lasiodiplodia hormozganensis TaxID=869390 RepID=A0AA39T0Y6_9PEZI|nr:Retinal-specific ATP-binding cassette transporter [Lasiodiplodia hormozganensis]
MAVLGQTWTLTKKNLLIVALRHPLSTILRAVLLPILFMFFISYAKNFFVPPSEFGIGSAAPVRSLENALNAAQGGRNKVVFVNNGLTGGDIETVINSIAGTVRSAGKKIAVVKTDIDLLSECPSSLRGVSTCFAAANFHSSPSEGTGGIWNYTLRADGALGERIYVEETNNDAQIYILPFQHAIDAEIASISGSSLPSTVNEYPFTPRTAQERRDQIRHSYMGALINILAVAFFIGICGITYQLTGHMASERELGMSQLIEAMTPNKHVWHTQVARLLANHLAFDIIYLPSWIIMAAIMRALVFPSSSYGLLIIYHLLAGLALSSFSILGGSLFRKAQLSGITVVLVSIILAIVAQVTKTRSVGAVAILSLLFPPMNYTYFMILLARFERKDRAANLVEGAPDSPWQLPGIAFWVFLIIQIFVFPVIGAFVERSLYGTASKTRKMTLDSADGPPVSIRLTNFTKRWQPSWWHRNVACRLGAARKETVLAVNDLSLSALRGQIMVLLGANGSGKSTTLDAISGLNTISSGSIEVDGNGGLGLCPQKNVMWDELTVFEHVKIFNSLKASKKDTKEQITELIRSCDLDIKVNAKAGTLSGGQKRKLQLAMMFTGGSRVCCVDEVSSGIDPLSRRKIWDILLAERGARTMLLTTHFLDEADFLSDFIVVLSRGNLKAEGTAVELKHNLGGGYRIVLDNALVQYAPNALQSVPRKVLFDKTVYQVADSAQASVLTAALEREGITQYQVNGPTIEDVFLKLAEEIHEQSSGPETVVQGANAKTLENIDPSKAASDSEYASEVKTEKGQLEMTTGKGTGFVKQTWVLFIKRLIILRRNWLPYLVAVLIPIVAAGLVTLFLQGFEGASCSPGASTNNPKSANFDQSEVIEDGLLIPVGPATAVSPRLLAAAFGIDASNFHLVNSLDEFNTYVADNYANVTPGGFYLEPNAAPTYAYVADNYQIYWSLLTQNILDTLLANTSIVTSFQSFAVPYSPGAGDTLQLILYFGLAMCAFTGFFALYPTMERIRKVRALHYSNGIRAAPLWIAYTMFDFLFVLLVSALVTIIFVGASGVWYSPGYLFVVFFLYGFTSILLSYVVSLFVTSQLAAFAFMAGGQAVFFLLYFIAYMSILTYSQAAYIDRDIKTAHFTIGIITPSGNLLRSLLLSLNSFSLLCRGDSIASYPGEITVYGGPILYLIIQAAVLFVILVWWDSGYKPAFLMRSTHKHKHVEETEARGADVTAEITRTEQSDDRLRVLHLTKHFGKNTAVDDITFGIPSGEVFALLGPNGAGKSTTISLIRGDERPSQPSDGSRRGDVLVEGISITQRRAAARGFLGVCPQFDAMDQMTVLEHLRFYARARGVPDVEQNVAAVVSAVGLALFQHRMAAKLSGGNKRKLSLAIALMGNPSALLLDEPSSGMDAAAKRVMWRTLGAVAAGRALLITTHSMEEADALATRAGIMARRMLAVGTGEELRQRFGDGWVVQVVLASAPASAQEEMDAVWKWVEENVPGAVLDPRVAHGQVRFTAPWSRGGGKVEGGGAGMGIAELFEKLERSKALLGIAYYSVGRTTLDQVFLSIVGRHDVKEES